MGPALGTGSGSDPADAHQASDGYRYPVNASGQTYGSVIHATSPDQEPDLIAVTATDDVDGYCLKSDMEDDISRARTPDEALAAGQRIEAARADAFLQALEKELGTSLDADRGSALAALQAVTATGYDPTLPGVPDVKMAARTVDVVDRTLGLDLATETVDEATMDALARAADEATTRTIPVYASDGRTVLGEFDIGGL